MSDTILAPPPYQTPLTNAQGVMNPLWARWFNQLYQRAGEGVAPSNNAILANPMNTLGDEIYGGSAGTASRLAGNSTTTKKFHTQTGTGAASAAPVWSTIAVADVPTLNQNTSGSAASLSATLAINQGGTSKTTASAAFDALSPMTALGDVIYGGTSGTGTKLAGNTTATKKFQTQTGTGAVSAAPAWSTIAAADVPTLNQNTSGSAASLSSTLVIGSGGTGQTTAGAAFDALSPMTTGGDLIYGGASGTGTRLANGTAGQVLTSQGTTVAPHWTSLSASGLYYFVSSKVTTNSTALTGSSFATFSNSPAFTFTPSQSGDYKVYCSAPARASSASDSFVLGIVNTTGSATLVASSNASLYVNATGIATDCTVNVFIQAIYTLTASTSYVFDIQGKCQRNIGSLSLNGSDSYNSGNPGSNFYMFAERVS